MQLKSFVKDMGKNAIVGITENGLLTADKLFLWNVAPNTHEVFRCVRKAITSKKKGVK